MNFELAVVALNTPDTREQDNNPTVGVQHKRYSGHLPRFTLKGVVKGLSTAPKPGGIYFKRNYPKPEA